MSTAGPGNPNSSDRIDRAFGSDNRARLLAQYFATNSHVTPSNAWLHVYKLLLWVDPTTGLAHCYESDKAQPGRHWYPRTLRFHDWMSNQLGTNPLDLAAVIDWLFRGALADMTASLSATQPKFVHEESVSYGGREFPRPGEDSALEALIVDELAAWMPRQPPREVLFALVARIHQHMRSENKRKNLIGEGFEDVLAALLGQLSLPQGLRLLSRPLLHEVPGFSEPPRREKPKRVDLAIIEAGNEQRMLVSCKWSVRADREEQFVSDFDAYARLERAGFPFQYVLVTNEFDPARLVAAADRQHLSRPLFNTVVHVNPEAVLAAYGGEEHRSYGKATERIRTGRIISLGRWLQDITGES